MVNAVFSVLADTVKENKLRNAIKSKTKNRLNSDDTDSIIKGVKLNLQYSINVYETESDFRKALDIEDGYRGHTLFGQALASTPWCVGELYDPSRAAAIIVRNMAKSDAPQQIHIYVPRPLTERR